MDSGGVGAECFKFKLLGFEAEKLSYQLLASSFKLAELEHSFQSSEPPQQNLGFLKQVHVILVWSGRAAEVAVGY